MRSALATSIEAAGLLWTPRSLGSSLIHWLRSDLGITLNGAKVSAWADQSLSAKHCTQGTDSKRPTYVAASQNGKPGVSFAAANLQLLNHTLTRAPAGTLFTVAKSTVLNNFNTIATYSGMNSFVTLTSTVSSKCGMYAGGDIASSYAGHGAATQQMIVAARAYNDVDIYVAANAKETIATGASVLSGMGIGAVGESNYGDVLVYEVALFSRVLVAAEIAKLQAYARNFWAVL